MSDILINIMHSYLVVMWFWTVFLVVSNKIKGTDDENKEIQLYIIFLNSDCSNITRYQKCKKWAWRWNEYP